MNPFSLSNSIRKGLDIKCENDTHKMGFIYVYCNDNFFSPFKKNGIKPKRNVTCYFDYYQK